MVVALTSFTLSVDWFDSCSDAELLCSILRWCDTNQGRYFREGCPEALIAPELAQELATLWAGQIVMRSNIVELLVDSHAAVHAMHGEVGIATNTVTITPWLSKVGRTSYGISFFISSGIDDIPLARVATVMVNVDPSNLQAAAPIPEHLVEPMRALAAASSEAAVSAGLSAGDIVVPEGLDGEAPADAFVWQTTVRVTDCDSLGHVNNAKYPLLAAEARAVAAHALPTGMNAGLTGGGSPHFFMCDYLGQPYPFETIDVAVWSEGRSTLRFQISKGADQNREVVSTMAMMLHLGANASL
jgi:acyl-CoA thioesterase FadM